MNRGAFGIALAVLALSACVVVPPAGGVRQPAYYEPTQGYSAPPMEFVEGGAPVYYDSEPGIPFYPIFLDTPGSCFCIVPMRYYNGVWLGLGGVVLHRGHFTFHTPSHHHREVWGRSGGAFNGMRPTRGRVEQVGNEMRPIPPQGSVHAQHFTPPPAPATPPGAPQQRGAYPQQAGQAQLAGEPQRGAFPQQAGQPRQDVDPRQGRVHHQEPAMQQPMPQAVPSQQAQARPPMPPPSMQQTVTPPPPPQARPQQGPAKGPRPEKKCTPEEHNEKKC